MNHYDRFGDMVDDEPIDAELLDDDFDPTTATSEDDQDPDAPDWPESITMDEIGDLLRACVARDQRTTSPADTLAWYQDLNLAGINYADASRALSHYYVNVWPNQSPERRFRATPGTIIEIVRAGRKARLAKSNWKYVPAHPEETGPEFVENYDRQRDSVADGNPHPKHIGNPQPRSEMQALVSGLANGKVLPRAVAELAAADLGRKPPEVVAVLKARREPARIVRCPHCHAQAMQPCVDGRGRPLSHGRRIHPSRIEAYVVSSFTCPTCGAEPGHGCIERLSDGTQRPYYDSVHRMRIEASTPPAEAA